MVAIMPWYKSAFNIKVKFDKQVALCALEASRFLGDANLAPSVLSGPFVGSPFLKCLLHTRVKGLTLASSSLNSSIQSRFLLRSIGKRWKDAHPRTFANNTIIARHHNITLLFTINFSTRKLTYDGNLQ